LAVLVAAFAAEIAKPSVMAAANLVNFMIYPLKKQPEV
jgi:hypothetical protein